MSWANGHRKRYLHHFAGYLILTDLSALILPKTSLRHRIGAN